MLTRARATLLLTLLLGGVIFFAADHHARAAAAAPAAWRVLIYMAADNDLAPAAMNSLAELEKAHGAGAIRVAAQIDLAAARSPGTHRWSGARRFISTRGALGGYRLAPVEDLGPIDSGAASSLRAFVTWAMDAIPGERTLLVLWGHGRGDRGLLVDASARSHLLPRDINAAVEGRAIDVLGMDICSMQTLDVASAVAGAAQYLAGSPSPRHALGWPYADLLAALENSPALSAWEVATWLALHAGSRGEEFTGSALDLHRVPELGARVEALLAAARALPTAERTRLIEAVSALPAIAPVARTVDLAAALALFEASLPEEASRARAALAASVIAEKHSAAFADTAGVAVTRARLGAKQR
jgi:Clostripain family